MTYTGPANGHPRFGGRGTRTQTTLWAGCQPISLQRLLELLESVRRGGV